MTKKETLKTRAAELLHRYDTMRRELRTLERDLHHAVREYAKADGYYVNMTKDTFRNQLQMEQQAERDHWEKHNA